MKQKYSLTIGWLYPELMSTYGDRGNIIVLQKRGEWRSVNIKVVNINENSSKEQLKSVDFIFGGGAQDREQAIVMKHLRTQGDTIRALIEKNIPALFVCGSPQLMGRYYEPAEGKRIEGLGIFDMISRHPGPDEPRLIGNVVAQPLFSHSGLDPESHEILKQVQDDRLLVGFENHGGRTYLGTTAKPFAKVLKGYGNNGGDGTEGVVYKNAIGSYLHGPLLPKNPEIADYLLEKALEVKYGEKIKLSPIDDMLELQAKETIKKRLGIT